LQVGTIKPIQKRLQFGIVVIVMVVAIGIIIVASRIVVPSK
jgi:hypothetical protein